jgi:membrane protein DedA with SNARE-associated domain
MGASRHWDKRIPHPPAKPLRGLCHHRRVDRRPAPLGRISKRLTSRWALAPWLVPALLHIHFHLHFHHYRGPAIDYGALAAASFASWVGLPGPGEPVLIAAAVLAAKHNLGIVSVMFVAFVAAVAGGLIGWLAGLWAGRTLVTAPGPFHKLRLKTVERGEKVFERYTWFAVILTPSWVAGIHRVRPGLYNIINVVTAAIWAVGIGMTSYLIGPSVVDAVNDLGTGLLIALGVGIVAVIAEEVLRRRRKRARQAAAKSGY